MLVHNAAPVGAVAKSDLVGFSIAPGKQLNTRPAGCVYWVRQVGFGRGKAAAVVESYGTAKITEAWFGADDHAVRLSAHNAVANRLPVWQIALGVKADEFHGCWGLEMGELAVVVIR